MWRLIGSSDELVTGMDAGNAIASSPIMEDSYSEREPSLSQLFDAIERKLDEIMMRSISCSGPSFNEQINDIVLRASGVWKKARYLQNSFAPINRFPRELLGYIPAFLQSERDLINTTAVCRHWRTTLLSTPQLWCKISGSSDVKIRAYLERSKWHPLNVHLTLSSSIRLLVPHIRRIASLHLEFSGQSQMERIAEYLVEPASSLRMLSISPRRVGHTLDIPPSFLGGSFPYLKSLFMEDISSFSGPHIFYSVTSLTLHTNPDVPLDTPHLLHALERLPSLETVLIKFRARGIPTSPAGDRRVTLQNLRNMALYSTHDACFGPILPGLRLPKLERLQVHSDSALKTKGACLPSSFSRFLPNFSELPKAVITPRSRCCEIHLQSEHEHALGIFIGRLSTFEETLGLLGGLPLRSVRSLTVEFPEGSDREWLFGMLGVMDGVEDIEIIGGWSQVLQFWGGDREREMLCPTLRRLTVHGEGAELDLASFKDSRRRVGLPLTARLSCGNQRRHIAS